MAIGTISRSDKQKPAEPIGGRGRNSRMMPPTTRFAGPANEMFSDYQKKYPLEFLFCS
jgi:hypothetical protein